MSILKCVKICPVEKKNLSGGEVTQQQTMGAGSRSERGIRFHDVFEEVTLFGSQGSDISHRFHLIRSSRVSDEKQFTIDEV
jgi:hypothetical protein